MIHPLVDPSIESSSQRLELVAIVHTLPAMHGSYQKLELRVGGRNLSFDIVAGKSITAESLIDFLNEKKTC